MSFEVLAGFMAVTGLMAWAVSSHQATWNALQTAWEAWAREQGFTYIPPVSSLFSQTSPRIEGKRRDVPIEIDTYTVSNGKTSLVYTRVRSHAQVPMAGLIEAHTKGTFDRLGDALGLHPLHTGDPRFDQRFTVSAEPPEAMATLFDADTRALLVAFAVESFSFRYFNGTATLSWVGLCQNATLLADACAIVAAAGVWRKDPTLYR